MCNQHPVMCDQHPVMCDQHPVMCDQHPGMQPAAVSCAAGPPVLPWPMPTLCVCLYSLPVVTIARSVAHWSDTPVQLLFMSQSVCHLCTIPTYDRQLQSFLCADSSQREKGLSRAVCTMKPGERCLVYITDPAYGYGDKGSFSFPSVPPSCQLVYEIEMLTWEPPAEVCGCRRRLKLQLHRNGQHACCTVVVVSSCWLVAAGG
jgi:hypothetical protein